MNNENNKEVFNNDFLKIFITEDDVFDINVYYYVQGDKLFVSGADDDFDSKKDSHVITLTLKYPNQGDVLTINRIKKNLSDSDNIDINSIVQLEYNRFLLLVRKWSLKEKIEEDVILKLHPKIVKGILQSIRDKIGVDGIF